MLDLLPANAKYYFTNAHIPRALSKELLAETALKKNLNGNCFDDVNEAIREAKKQAKINDVIIVCGSFFILSEIEPF
jgi:dihydrofolate synthase/folylpolyglutamate synthase